MSGSDIVLVGAGCAGLSLAWHLLDAGVDRRIVLIDRREAYARDRTWCFFDVVAHPFEDAVSHRWDRWRVRASEGAPWIERSAAGLRYAHLPSDAFYERVLARLRASPQVELRLGTRVDAIADDAHGVEVHTNDGVVRGGVAIDSRPPRLEARRAPGREVSLLQHFAGWEVETAEPRFDPSLATLMDFGVPQVGGIHFFYVLPLGPRRALVEATWFGTHVPDESVYEAAIERYLRGPLEVREYSVRRRERGVIPMSTVATPRRTSLRLYRAGLLGGMAKPSTGYAFLAIQEYSAELAAKMAREELPEPPEPRPWRSRMQDRVFLSYLSRHENRAPATLTRLFERVEPRLLAKFLNDRASAREGLTVMTAMPMLRMTTELVRSPRIWMRT